MTTHFPLVFFTTTPAKDFITGKALVGLLEATVSILLRAHHLVSPTYGEDFGIFTEGLEWSGLCMTLPTHGEVRGL